MMKHGFPAGAWEAAVSNKLNIICNYSANQAAGRLTIKKLQTYKIQRLIFL